MLSEIRGISFFIKPILPNGKSQNNKNRLCHGFKIKQNKKIMVYSRFVEYHQNACVWQWLKANKQANNNKKTVNKTPVLQSLS